MYRNVINFDKKYQDPTVCSTSIILTPLGHKAIITSVVLMAGDQWHKVDLLDAEIMIPVSG
jgi:hypothetical protein